MNLVVFSVTASPYQRDFFAALSRLAGVTLKVHYLEVDAPDSPWPKKPLAAYEDILSGGVFGRGRVRCHWNRLGTTLDTADAVLVNTPLTAITTQFLFRIALQQRPWFFWAERIQSGGGFWKRFLRRQLAAPLAGASGIFAVGSGAASAYQKSFPWVPVWNMPYRCDLTEFTNACENRHKSDSTPLTFLFCGQMIPRKGIDILLKSFEVIVQTGRHVRLILAGREAEVHHLIAALAPETQRHIELRGFTAPEDLPSLFSEADVFLLPSRYDGWGVVVNQAIGSGLPVITTTAVGAAQDLVKDGVSGFVIAPGNAEALVNAMQRLVDDRALLSSMAAASHSVRSWLEPDHGAKEMFEVVGCGRTRASQV